MAPKVTVLKVCILSGKCQTKLFTAIAKLEGVDKIEADLEKSTVTVTGNVDPHEIIVCARKAGKYAEIVSIGDPEKGDDEKQGEDDEEPCHFHPVAYPYDIVTGPGPTCTIS